MARISDGELKNLNELIAKDPHKALELLASCEELYSDDPYLRLNRGGFLVDIGAALGDTRLVQQGIDSIAQLLASIEERHRPSQLYNLANGYAALHSIARREPGFHFSPDTTPLREAKGRYREALAGEAHLDADLRAQLRVNYGNCLAHLGRSLEAIAQYNAALSPAPDHPMAWGNLGIELERFAFIARDTAVLEHARECLLKALADDRLEQIGEPWTRSCFQKAERRIEGLLRNLGERMPPRIAQLPTSSTPHLRAYIDFCVKHQLFLNLCLRDRPCQHLAEDTVSLLLTTSLGDDTTYPRLARVVNEIKERYAAARLLLFEACNPPFDTEPYDQMTYYADNLDYAVYGIRPAKLKTAFEGAYNVLDKLALFVNAYLDVGIEERRVSFQRVWRGNKAAGLRPSIDQCGNYHLYALYDLSRDLGPQGYLQHLRRTRDYLTHRYLVLHVERLHWPTRAEPAQHHSGYRELLDHTIELMQLVRSAVIYLIAFIDQEERAKRRDAQGSIAASPVPLCRSYPLGPQDAPI